MGLFDNDPNSTFDINNPTFLALLGALGGLGKAAAPSRLPVTSGQVWGSAAEGLLSGAKSGSETQGLTILNELRKAQAQEATGRGKALSNLDLNSITGGGGNAVMPGLAPPPRTLGPLDRAGGVGMTPTGTARPAATGGLGRHATEAAATLSNLGWSDAAIQGALANGLAEGTFSEPWKKSTVENENSFGHWQFNDKGELPTYMSWAQGKGDPFSTPLQATYLAKRMEEIQPGFGKIDDPKKATDIIGLQFERYKGAEPGQRYPHLDRVQREIGTQFAQAPGATATDAGQPGAPLAIAPGAGAVNIDPLALAKQRALMAMGGIAGDPLKGFSEAYYNSPQYKAGVAAAEKGATLPIEQQYAGPMASAKAAGDRSVTEPSDIRIAQAKEIIAREQAVILEREKLNEQIKRQFPSGAPEGTAAATKALEVEAARAEKGYRQVPVPGGGYRVEPIPGTPQAMAEQEKEAAKGMAAGTVTQDIDRALGMAGPMTTGIVGSKLQGVWQPSRDLSELLATIKSNIGFERLQQMRNTSPTGGALGPVSDTENKLLQSTMGSVEQSQGREQFEYNMKKLREKYQDVVFGSPAHLDKLLGEGKITREQRDASIAARMPQVAERGAVGAVGQEGASVTAPVPPKLPTGAAEQRMDGGRWYYRIGKQWYPHQ